MHILKDLIHILDKNVAGREQIFHNHKDLM